MNVSACIFLNSRIQNMEQVSFTVGEEGQVFMSLEWQLLNM